MNKTKKLIYLLLFCSILLLTPAASFAEGNGEAMEGSGEAAVTLTAAGYATIELFGITGSMKCSVNGGEAAMTLTEKGTYTVGGLAEGDHILVSDSNTKETKLEAMLSMAGSPGDIQTIDSTAGQSDGKITGVDGTMEYCLAGQTGDMDTWSWKSVDGTEITGLAAGTYYVRARANGQTLASAYVSVTVGEKQAPVGENKALAASGVKATPAGYHTVELSGITKGMVYTINGGNKKAFTDIKDGVAYVRLDANQKLCVYVSNGSEEPLLDTYFGRGTELTRIQKTHNTPGQADGEIICMDSMFTEYCLADSATAGIDVDNWEWKKMNMGKAENLSEGTYYVRKQSNAKSFASEYTAVKIGVDIQFEAIGYSTAKLHGVEANMKCDGPYPPQKTIISASSIKDGAFTVTGIQNGITIFSVYDIWEKLLVAFDVSWEDNSGFSLKAEECTPGQADGKIIVENSSGKQLEYCRNNNDENIGNADAYTTWMPVSGNEITGLEAGEYWVRVKAHGQVFASRPRTVEVEERSPFTLNTDNLKYARAVASDVKADGNRVSLTLTVSPSSKYSFAEAPEVTVSNAGIPEPSRQPDGSFVFQLDIPRYSVVEVSGEGAIFAVNGENILTAPNYTVTCGSGFARYDADKGILYLDNAVMTKSYDMGGYLQNDMIYSTLKTPLTIIVNGDNTLGKDPESGKCSDAIDVRGNLIITGTGTLNLYSNIGGVFASECAIDNCRINLYGQGDMGIKAKTLEVKNNSEIYASNCRVLDTDQYTGDRLTIADSKVIVENLQSNSSLGAGGDILIQNSSLEFRNETAANHIFAQKNVRIEHSDLTFAESGVPSIWAGNGTIEIVNGSRAEVIAGNAIAIYSGNGIKIENSVVKAQTGSLGNTVYSLDGVLNISGSWVESIGGSGLGGVISAEDSVLFTNDSGEVKGDFKMPGDVKVSENMKLTIPEKTSFTVTEKTVFENYGEIILTGSFINNNGTVICANHIGGVADCVKRAVCRICGQEYGKLKEHNLSYCEPKAPACAEAGELEHWHCRVCARDFSDEAGLQLLSSIADPALGHEIVKVERREPTANEDGNILYWYCKRCYTYFKDAGLTQIISKEDTVLKAAGEPSSPETQEPQNPVEPGETQDPESSVKPGETQESFILDESVKPEGTINPGQNGTGSGPQTGDNVSPVILFLLMAASAAVLAAAAVFYIIKKEKK
ncbi:MAG: hypothetical protein KHX56_07880 [Clostridiales bacterium]|nr:hypothetical protein [Clostridiales bacterium]